MEYLMSNKAFDVNMKEVIELTDKLEQLHRSALPSAIRNTLNDAALKTKELAPKVAKQKFITRSPSFIKAFTAANKAKGFDVNTMRADVGFNKSKGSKVADGLEKQEKGGIIAGRKLIPHDKGRVSKSHSKRLRGKHKFTSISIGTSKRRKKGLKYFLIKKGGKGTVFERVGKKIVPIYHYRSTKKSRVSRIGFIESSAKLATKKIPEFYKNNAEFQIKKHLK